MTKTSKLLLAVVPFLLSVACTDANKAPAEAAVKAAEAAAMTLNEQVAKFAPDEVKAFRDGLDAARAALAKKDYKAARAAAEGLPAKASQAFAAAQAKQEAAAKAAAAAAAAAKKAFDEEGAVLSKKLEGLKKHVSVLAKAKKLPKGITKAAVSKAKEAVASLESGFEKAKAQVATDAAAAAAEAKELAQKAAELAKSLKMK